MENHSEQQLSEEVNRLNRRLTELEQKIEKEPRKRRHPLWEACLYLLAGIFLLGPALALGMGLLELLDSWMSR
ncbi:hypothetical protein ERJ70_17250 [Sediminibacillus dalangtanensis]|uniref:Uncharacterized protein n=1 Tax=Sediminibacillus dalangtanensis TaxID=2729421 RepID=A0ABX7VW16_9BACI|nr:hypothetical protein [Sediminibacillus dalangtanensis]QTN00877.1 hypothetical protein ERJ70_17250 [Sediminibacillus dalangtanensis]